MNRQYAAFLLRHWQQGDGREWVEVQFVATGERHRFPTLAAACTWLQACVRSRAASGQGEATAPSRGDGAASST